MALLSPLCQLNGGCMGCCGHDFLSKKLVIQAIDENTKQFKILYNNDEPSLIYFRDRFHSSNLRYGVCRNLIKDNETLLCPLHPARNNGKDLRIGHCDVNHLCKTAKIFATWSEEKQHKFIKLIESKNLSNIDYSMAMDKSTLLKEFN